jgi:hypothetical protein
VTPEDYGVGRNAVAADGKTIVDSYNRPVGDVYLVDGLK